MSEQTDPLPEQSPAGEGRLKRTVRTVGMSVGCLVWLVVALLVCGAAIATVLDEPGVFIPLIALFVAIAALKASRRR